MNTEHVFECVIVTLFLDPHIETSYEEVLLLMVILHENKVIELYDGNHHRKCSIQHSQKGSFFVTVDTKSVNTQIPFKLLAKSREK